MPCVRIQGSTQCAVEKAPTGSQLLTCYFFFFFFFLKKYELSDEFGSEKYAETGDLDLENLIKAEMDNFDKGIWCYLSVQTGCYTDGWGRRGKAAVGGYRVQSLKNPRFVPPVLEL